MISEGGPQGGGISRSSGRADWGGALVISNKQRVEMQKSESKMYKPGHTKRAKRGGGY